MHRDISKSSQQSCKPKRIALKDLHAASFLHSLPADLSRCLDCCCFAFRACVVGHLRHHDDEARSMPRSMGHSQSHQKGDTGSMHQRSRRRDSSDGKARGSPPSQLGAGWTLTACCLLGCCLSAVPDLCSAFGTVGTASTAARSSLRSSYASSRLPSTLSEERSIIKSHDVAATALGAATTATFEDVAALSQPEADATDDADETTKVGVLLLNLGGPETGEDVEGKLIGFFLL